MHIVYTVDIDDITLHTLVDNAVTGLGRERLIQNVLRVTPHDRMRRESIDQCLTWNVRVILQIGAQILGYFVWIFG